MLGIHRVFAFVTTLSQSRASLDPAVGSADHLPRMLHDDLQLRIPPALTTPFRRFDFLKPRRISADPRARASLFKQRKKHDGSSDGITLDRRERANWTKGRPNGGGLLSPARAGPPKSVAVSKNQNVGKALLERVGFSAAGHREACWGDDRLNRRPGRGTRGTAIMS